MNMRKTITWTIAMVAAASMALAGCGGNGAGDASASKSGYVPAGGRRSVGLYGNIARSGRVEGI